MFRYYRDTPLVICLVSRSVCAVPGRHQPIQNGFDRLEEGVRLNGGCIDGAVIVDLPSMFVPFPDVLSLHGPERVDRDNDP